MRYYSTRGQAESVPAAETVLKGLAPDGGLYVPAETTKPLTLENLPAGNYQQIASFIFKFFLADFSSTDIEHAVRSAYNLETFEHPAIAPLKHISNKLYFLELWHGPTCAFKDIALQVLPYLLNTAVHKNSDMRKVVILTATSGDTGKSALEGFRDVPGIKIIVYFPEKGVSEIQKQQMITQEGSNVEVIAVQGNFDDTQTGVKQIFNDYILSKQLSEAGYRLSSANSINWGRLLPQIVYYFYAYRELTGQGAIKPGQRVNFVVPTGNFGNILAGYYASRLGLPVNRLICAANRNNVLANFINSGIYDRRRSLHISLSPSMDILVSSNLERLLFEITGHDSQRINTWMKELINTGQYRIDRETMIKLQELFWSDYADDEKTLQAISETYQNYNYLIDPHTAVGKKVLDNYMARENDPSPSVILSTASPYKFTGSTVRALFGSSRFKDISELKLINILAGETNTPVPKSLAELDQKPVKHRQLIAPEDMRSQLLETLKID